MKQRPRIYYSEGQKAMMWPRVGHGPAEPLTSCGIMMTILTTMMMSIMVIAIVMIVSLR